jgi:hypothetical protein
LVGAKIEAGLVCLGSMVAGRDCRRKKPDGDVRLLAWRPAPTQTGIPIPLVMAWNARSVVNAKKLGQGRGQG